MTSMNRISSAINAHTLIEQVQVMMGSVEQAYRRGQAVHPLCQDSCRLLICPGYRVVRSPWGD